VFKIFSKSSSGTPDYSPLAVDMHSHLLPGIDDGSPDLETSLHLIRRMMQMGFKKFITTPHIMWEMYRNTPAIIGEKLELLREAVKKEGIDVEIDAAAEYFLDEHVERLLAQKEKLLTLHDNHVLIEFSMASQPFNIKEVLFEMTMQGYQPVIAHPERYIYFEQSKDFYDELRDAGHLFQLNLNSLSGYYGKSVYNLALYLVKKGYYDYLGSDLHHLRHIEGLSSSALTGELKKLLESGKIINPKLI
jgi:tyrosine-protein phosphatase YwqE